MKKKTVQTIVLGLVLLGATAALADGDIYVGGPWGTRIASLPYEIKTPGAYYLGGNLTYAGAGDGITLPLGVNHVTLDLMGFTINGSGSGRNGIALNGNKNMEIRNGTVTGWGTGIADRNGGGGFDRILNVRAVGNSSGIHLAGYSHLVQGCEVTATGTGSAIFCAYGTVSGCTVSFVDGQGIENAGIMSNNVVLSTGTGGTRYGIYTYDGRALIKGNKVSGCGYGIYSESSGLNVIGNMVDAASGATGIFLTDESSNLLDQNTVTGAGTHYNAAYIHVQKRNNF